MEIEKLARLIHEEFIAFCAKDMQEHAEDWPSHFLPDMMGWSQCPEWKKRMYRHTAKIVKDALCTSRTEK